MKNAARVLTATLIFLSALLLGQTLPSVPSTLSYQGRLADGSLAPVPDGEYEMSFLIFSASSGGTLLWSETQPDVEVTGGAYKVELGRIEPIPFSGFQGPSRYLEVRIYGETVTPRRRLVSTPFALKAEGEIPTGALVLAETSGDSSITNLGYTEQGDTIGPYYLFQAGTRNPLLEFKELFDAQEKVLLERGFDNNDVLKRWDIADQLMLSLYNFHQQDADISALEEELTFKDKSSLGLEAFDQKVGQTHIGVSYDFIRADDEGGLFFNARSIPLNSSGTIFLLLYSRRETNQTLCIGPCPSIETFHIMMLDNKTEQYFITSKQEESNFNKQLALTGKLRYWPPWQEADPIPPYLASGGSLIPDSIKEEGKAIKFDTHWARCRPGGPCYDDMIISWVYADKTLRATHYVDSYQSDWNEEKQIWEYKVDRVELSP